MSTLHVRNVPDDLYEALRQRARVERRSLSAEVVLLLERALRETPPPLDVLERVRARRGVVPSELGAPGSLALLREDRDR